MVGVIALQTHLNQTRVANARQRVTGEQFTTPDKQLVLDLKGLM